MDIDFKKIIAGLQKRVNRTASDKSQTEMLHRDWILIVSVTLFLTLLSAVFGFYVFYQNSYSSPFVEEAGGASSQTFSREKLNSVIEKLDLKKQKFDALKAKPPTTPTP